MATLAQIQEAARLKRAWTPISEAVSQVRTATPVTTTPVTPTPTTPTQQFPSQPINQQTVSGVNGETFQVAPVNQQGITPQAPQSVAPTQPVQPTTPTTPTPVDKTAEIQAKNQAQMEANAQKSQLAIQERKKATEDAKLASIPTDQKWIVQSLISWVSVPAQNTAAYRNANTIYTQFKKYNSMTDTELLSNLKQGNIGSELDGYLQSNPNYTLAKQKLAQEQKIASLNRIGQSVMNVAGWKEPVDLWDLTSVEAKYNPPVGVNEQAYLDHVTNNADVIRTGTELKKISTQISEASTAYNSALKDLQKQYSGKLSASALLTLMGSRTRDTKDLIDSLVNAKDLAKGDFDLAMKMAEGEYGAIQADIKAQQDIETENRKNQAAKDLEFYKAQLWLDTKQAEFDQQIAQKAQAMNDPTTAISTMVEEYKKLGIPFSRSTQQIISDFQTSGLDLPTYLSNLQSTIQAKPEYQKIQSLQMGQLSDVQKMQLGYQQDINKMAIGNQYDLTKMGINNQQDLQKLMLSYNLGNQKDIQSSKIDLMGKWFTPDQADAIVRTATGNWKWATWETLLSAPNSTIIPSRLSETTNPNGGKECGEYVNDIVGSWTVGSTWASKSSKIDSSITVPTVGNTAVWIPDPSNPTFAQYGHAGIITEVNGNNVTIKSSNYNWQGEISTITIPISEITKTGGFIGTAIKWPWKTSWLNKDEVKNINGLYDDLKTIDTFKNWKAISSQVTWFNDLKNKELNGSDIQGLITNYAKVLDPTSVVRESEFAMAQKWANQWAIDRAKTSIATYLNGGSAVLSKEAQEALKSAMGRRFDAVKEAYVNEVDAQVARGKQMGMPVTWENLTGESRDSYTKWAQPTQWNLVISKEAALDLYNKWKANQ